MSGIRIPRTLDGRKTCIFAVNGEIRLFSDTYPLQFNGCFENRTNNSHDFSVYFCKFMVAFCTGSQACACPMQLYGCITETHPPRFPHHCRLLVVFTSMAKRSKIGVVKSVFLFHSDSLLSFYYLVFCPQFVFYHREYPQ